LRRRLSLTDIKCLDDVNDLRKEEIEDILHSNFVSFDASDSVDRLASKLQGLWSDTKSRRD
jgi:hypothetical protein